ncbi:MAG: hypothetical protein KatS3mg108_0855 [Isosphaeraceae bacterium]|jgi:uncharacterized membrane protein YjfL (UPF0719 family)|nr:MAG: hypothetical protein KatS3mg108_0855 [Isosphaeraceae bacterium]
MTVMLSLGLIGLGIAMRLMPHDPNWIALFSPLALALFAGARLPRRLGWLVPVVVLVVTDLVLTWSTPYRPWLWSAENLARYGAILGVVALGRAAARLENPLSWTTMAFLGGLFFYLLTNFAVWAAPPNLPSVVPYPRTLAGLMACYGAALPYFRNMLAGDLSSTLVLFGIDWAVRRVWSGRAAAVEAIAVRTD